jgi:MscS family membrane protein
MINLRNSPRHRWPIRMLWLGILVISVLPWQAFDAAGQVDEDQIPGPLAPADTTSPQATLTSLIDNVNISYRELEEVLDAYDQGQPLPAKAVAQHVEQAEWALERAIQTLDLSLTPPIRRDTVGLETVLLFKEVLDRIDLPAMAEVPDATVLEALGLGHQDPYRWRIPGTQLDIARVTEGPRAGEFLFSPQTVKRLAGDYKRVRDLPYQPGASEGFYEFYVATPGQLVPPRWAAWLLSLPDWTFTLYGGQAVWQWVGLGLALFLLVALVVGVYRLSHRIKPRGPLSRMLLRILTPVTVILATAAAGYFVDEQLNFSGEVLGIELALQVVVNHLMAAWVVWIVANGIAAWVIDSPRIQQRGLNASLTRLVLRSSAVILIALIIASGLSQLGVPTVAIITAMGVGGLAISLAASPTLENLIGGLSLFADRPVRIGDLCRYGDNEGFVEEIGIRSVKIRGWDRTVTTVPNADFAKMQITNISRLNHRLLELTLSLRSETTPEQLRFVLVKLRELLLAHPQMSIDDPARVRFKGIGVCSLDIEVFAYANTTDLYEFLAIKEDVLLRIMDVVSEAGTDFATPEQLTYLAHDVGLETDHVRAAEAQVQAWREAGTLPFPEFAEDYRQQIENTLDYPPAGSPEEDHP